MTTPPAHPLKGLWKALVEAAAGGDHASADRLLAEHPELLNHREFWSQTALHYLVIESDFDAVDFLLSRNADVNLGDEHTGDTPLHSACKLGNALMVDRLLAAGADPNVRSTLDGTPLDIAFHELNGITTIIEKLNARGARRTPE